MQNYEPREIEAKWQKKWIEEKVFKAKDDSAKSKYYQLETFPYPSAAGLHVGHPKGFTAEDIHARYMRMGGRDAKQREVLYTIGWDAFGLPTENYAIKIGRNPKEVTAENIANFTRQVRMFGFSYDWDRELNTSSPEYYRWTQWLFIQLYKKGLAYQAMAKVNWCPKDQTVLANEQVIDGKCERCGTVIEERDMEQWFFKITHYAERLLADLTGLDWPAATVKRQEDWIGKSEGAIIKFEGPYSLEVFTTRPDTLFGATFLVIAPEVAQQWIDAGWAASEEVKKYIETSTHKTERERLQGIEDKTGVPTGTFAVNPVTKGEIPVWVADYVLGSYGTGAIMAVPAHDERDRAFAKKFGLPSVTVITPEGTLQNSGAFDGMDAKTAGSEIVRAANGSKKTQYKIRDWSVSRQRYWGAPVPMIHCETCGIIPVDEKDLPVLLPNLENYRPQGLPPLAGAPEFMNVKCPKCGRDAERDPETLDTFVDSSWYFLRYPDAHNDTAIFSKDKADHWMPVDLYVIGAEHTVLHLLYARFITKFLHDEGMVKFEEPFLKLRHQGLVIGADGHKMSKSKGNVVNPDELVREFGADATRMYLMFMGPFEDGAPWDSKGILGIERFLKRFWKYVGEGIGKENVLGDGHDAASAKKFLHRTIKKVGEDIEHFKFNTAISALMILLNELEKMPATALDSAAREALVKIIHPFAPHMAQELWSLMGHETYLDFEAWPHYDEALFAEKTIRLIFQVNGRVRDAVEVDALITEEQAKKAALQSVKVKNAVGGAQPKKMIYIDKKLVNIVI